MQNYGEEKVKHLYWEAEIKFKDIENASLLSSILIQTKQAQRKMSSVINLIIKITYLNETFK